MLQYNIPYCIKWVWSLGFSLRPINKCSKNFICEKCGISLVYKTSYHDSRPQRNSSFPNRKDVIDDDVDISDAGHKWIFSLRAATPPLIDEFDLASFFLSTYADLTCICHSLCASTLSLICLLINVRFLVKVELPPERSSSFWDSWVPIMIYNTVETPQTTAQKFL